MGEAPNCGNGMSVAEFGARVPAMQKHCFFLAGKMNNKGQASLCLLDYCRSIVGTSLESKLLDEFSSLVGKLKGQVQGTFQAADVQELPWILEDIAIGQKRRSKRSGAAGKLELVPLTQRTVLQKINAQVVQKFPAPPSL